MPTLCEAKDSIREVKVIRGVYHQVYSYEYFHHILTVALALNEKGHKYTLTPVEFELPQNRTLRLLNSPGVLDITQSMTSKEREADYIAIKIPLLNGMNGKRLLLVEAKNKAKFEDISYEALRKKVACQSGHWPDYDKLRANGFAVFGAHNYEANFKMLAKGRCDYIPRAMAEIKLDYDKYDGKFGNLAIVQSVMLKYEAPVYFFVGKHNQELADAVKSGLSKMQESGSLKQAQLSIEAFQYDHKMDLSQHVKVYHLD